MRGVGERTRLIALEASEIHLEQECHNEVILKDESGSNCRGHIRVSVSSMITS